MDFKALEFHNIIIITIQEWLNEHSRIGKRMKDGKTWYYFKDYSSKFPMDNNVNYNIAH